MHFISEFGNPFLEDSEDSLISLGNGVIVQGETAKVINQIESTVIEGVQAYVKSRMQTKSVPITKGLKKNNATFFNTPNKKTSKQNIITLKNGVALFSRLFIASQQREWDFSEFFAHENQGQPPSLSLNNNLRPGNKPSLVKYSEDHVDNIALPVVPFHDAYMVDGAVIVNPIKNLVMAKHSSNMQLNT